MRTTSSTVAVLAVALAISACGDKADPVAKAQEASRTSAKQTFQARADRTCQAMPTLIPTAPPRLAGLTASAVRTSAAARLDALRRLGAPEKDRRLLQRYFQALESMVRKLPAVEAAARRGDRAGMRSAIGRARSSQSRAAVLARRYGLARCA